MSKSCVICGTEESEGELLLEAPCARHWVCADDVGSFFENATNNESLFPPQCCGAMFMLEDYEDHVPFEMAWAYQMKQQGEYSILAKFRIYCANPPCGKFLHPGSHVKDPETKITYAVCEAEECGKLTCVKCRTRLDQGTQNHECKQNEDEKKFKQMANEKGYQECFLCGAIVELAEACNHITCECGNSFCYICGGDWPGLHGCPHYGPAVYDEEGYNQDGYHRDTGLNRLGLTRRQEMIRARAEGEEQHDEGGNEGEVENEDDENEDTEWEVLQHLTLDQRTMINQLPHGPRQDALDQFRMTLFKTQGIIFNQFGPPPPPPPPQDFGDDGDAWEDDDGEDSENDQGEDPLLAGALAGPTPAEVLALEAFDEFFLALTNEEDHNVESDAMESDEDLASVPDPWDDGDDVDAFDGHQGEYIITDEEGSQEDRFADGQSETSDFGTETPLLDRNSEETDQLETASPVDSPSQVQQVPENYAFTFTAGTDTAAEAASLPTDGPYAVVARGFTSGTTVEDVESVVNQHGGPVIGRTLLGSDPLIVELQFATKKSADAVILLFHGKKADGQILDVRMKDEGELLDDEDL